MIILTAVFDMIRKNYNEAQHEELTTALNTLRR